MADKTLAKLTIEAYPDKKFDKAFDSFKVLFNPTEYAFARSNEYSKPKGSGHSKPESAYVSGNPDQLTLALFFDGTGAMGAPGPVTNDVWRFMDLMRYQGKLHKPAYLQLTWGGRTGGLNFRGYLKTATATFTLFNRSGEPIRAKVNASFEEAISANERLRQQNSSSPDLLRTWEVEAHQTLYLIAQEAYGDTRYWRAIARVNEIESPRSLTVGTILMLPAAAR